MSRTLTTDEKLVLLIEECGEVIQAATKCLRFGYERNWPDYGVNHEVLSKELGDLIGVVDSLPLDWNLIAMFRGMKMAKAERVKALIAANGTDTAAIHSDPNGTETKQTVDMSRSKFDL